jgi:hypothetical protein
MAPVGGKQEQQAAQRKRAKGAEQSLSLCTCEQHDTHTRLLVEQCCGPAAATAIGSIQMQNIRRCVTCQVLYPLEAADSRTMVLYTDQADMPW